MDREEYLQQAIQKGTVNDRDIEDIISHGSRSLKRQLDERSEYLWKEKKHLDNVYGAGVFDGRDDQGRLYKDLDNTDLVKELKGRSL